MDRKKFLKTIAIVPFIHLAAGCPDETAAAGEQCKTDRDAEGPFYKAGAPARAIIETEGTPLRIEGRVLQSANCQTPVAKATLDIWHCDHHGDYDNDGYKCRGQVTTDADGKYSFTTIFPPPYGNRPRHIHFKIRAAGYKELTTQLYFEGDPDINNDFARNAEKDRVIALEEGKDFKTGYFDIYL